MLDKLLTEIRNGGTLEPTLLAARLDVSPQMVAAMLDHLERLGALQDLSKCGDQGCGKCSLSGSCGVKGGKGARVWQVR